MNYSLLRSATAALALTGIFMTSIAAPARADGAATTRTIIGVAAAVAGIATAINVEHKNATANQVVGYLQDGSTVYGDGHVVAPNGYSWYPGNQGEQIACNGQQCSVYSNGQNGYGYNQYNNNGYNPYNNSGRYNGNNGYNPNNNNGYNNNGYYNNGYNNSGYNNGGYYGYAQPQEHRRRPPQ